LENRSDSFIKQCFATSINEAGEPAKSFNYLGAFIEQENENGIPTRQKTLRERVTFATSIYT
jgi:hypothetical protein